MKHPYEKWFITETVSLILAFLLGIFAMIKGTIILILIALYGIAISLMCEAFIAWSMKRTAIAGKQCIRAIIIIFFSTYALFIL
mgnify:FL=1